MTNHSGGGPRIPRWTLADRLRKIRRDHQLTQEQMGALLNVKPVTLAAWESGRNRPDNELAIARRIEEAFGVPAAWTLGLLEEPRRIDGRRWSDRFLGTAAAGPSTAYEIAG